MADPTKYLSLDESKRKLLLYAAVLAGVFILLNVLNPRGAR